MINFFNKLFRSKKSDEKILAQEVLQNIISLSKLEISFEIEVDNDEHDPKLIIEFFGPDESYFVSKGAELVEAFQLYLKRVIQHQFPETKFDVLCDCNGFRTQVNNELVELADKLKEVALEKNRPVYFRALPPKERKVVHQHLAQDERVKSRSVGEGHHKKIKIYPVRMST